MKKIISLLMAIMMLFSLSATCFADEGIMLLTTTAVPKMTIAENTATVYLTINDQCELAKTKDGDLAILLPVEVSLPAKLNDVLTKAHELYCSEGIDGYKSEETSFGTSVMMFWGNDNGTAYGYYKNNQMIMSSADEVVEDGDVIDFFIYKHPDDFSDVYTYLVYEDSEIGKTSLTAYYTAFDENFNVISMPLEGSEIFLVDGNTLTSTNVKTDAEGKATIDNPDEITVFAAVKEDCVVSVCTAPIDIDFISEEITDEPIVEAKPETYTVVKGDCLWKIAKKLLGDATLWTKIFDLNKSAIKDPNLIFVGQELIIK